MKIIRGIYNRPLQWDGCVVTIGNFDGIHLGHQAVIDQLNRESIQYKLPSVLMTFEPLPNEYFSSNQPPSRITPLRDKIDALNNLSLDYLLLMAFRSQLAQLKAEEFIQQILVKSLAVRSVVIGDDFRFGYQRKGDFELLKRLGQQHGYSTTATTSLQVNRQRVSSTIIRNALKKGNFKKTNELLGRPYTLSGRVGKGSQIGRQLGFPTANIHILHRIPAIQGIFIVTVEYGKKTYPAVASLGTRPAVGGDQMKLEVHLLDFSENLYGEHLKVVFLAKIRDEKNFDSFDALADAIAKDVEQAKMYFKNKGSDHAEVV